jgi:hypothetical protein
MLSSRLPILLRRSAAAAPPPAPSGSFSSFSEPWSGAALDPLQAAWTDIGGAPRIESIGGFQFYQNTGGALTWATRDAGGSKGVIELPFNGTNSGVYNSGTWPIIYFRSNLAFTDYCQVIFRQDTNKIQYIETIGGVQSNVLNGTNTLATGGTWHGIRITLGNTSLLVEVDSVGGGGGNYVTEISGTCVALLTNQYAGLGTGTGSNGLVFGPYTIGP